MSVRCLSYHETNMAHNERNAVKDRFTEAQGGLLQLTFILGELVPFTQVVP